MAEPMRSGHQHQILGIGCSLVGTPLAQTMVWDAMRSLDYLQSRPEVEPAKLGATGYSGGGNLTALLMALDERVADRTETGDDRSARTAGPQRLGAGRERAVTGAGDVLRPFLTASGLEVPLEGHLVAGRR